MSLRRRSILEVVLLIIIGVAGVMWVVGGRAKPSKSEALLHEAKYYHALSDGRVQCDLCFRGCVIGPGKRGVCRNRENRGGKLYNLVYGKPAAIHIDPIEKEPQYHVLPGSKILCFGTAGCNFRCIFCHNWHLSYSSVEETANFSISPEEAVEMAVQHGVPTISFTYNEPIAFYEYMYDIAKLAKARGLKTIFHSNGSLNPEPLRDLLKYMDAVTIDLKGFTPKFYEVVAAADLAPVLRTLKIIREEGLHLEIVNLIIPTLNDDMVKIRQMCEWIKENLGEDTPLHFSRFFPAHKLRDLPPTSVETLEQAREIAQEVGLNYVSVGNVPGHRYNSTFCPRCKKRLIHRIHFSVLANNIVDGKCKFCQNEVPGIWQ